MTAGVEITLEDSRYPIESAWIHGNEGGWASPDVR